MNKFKRILSGLLAAVMTVSAASMLSVGAANVTFTDVSDHWAWKDGYIPYLVEKDVLNGYQQSNGTYMFKPNGQVKRSEFIKMMDETFGLTKTTSINFKDVKTSDWFYPYFQKAAAQGYLLDYGTEANPDGYITREEAAALLVRYLDLPDYEKAPVSTFSDYNTITAKYRTYVLCAVYAGILEGYEEGGKSYFKPQKTLSRAEALTILYRAAGCIFNENATYRSGAAADENNTITKGGLSISNVRFNGRNIITEGAASGKITFYDCDINGTMVVRGGAEVTFNDCTIENLVLLGGGNVSLVSGSTAESVTIYKTTTLGIYSNTSVELLTVEDGANRSKVVGGGTLVEAVINADNFTSSLMPSDFEIGDNLTAVFDGEEFGGNSDAIQAFSVAPFATTDSSYYYLNVVSQVNGEIYYYYSNNEDAPSSSEFESNYNLSSYYGNFEVRAGKATTAKTKDAATGNKFRYVVIQLREENRRYSPLVIDNTVVADSGFSKEPYVHDRLTIKFQAATQSTLYWYYANNGGNISALEFLTEYETKTGGLSGTAKVSPSKLMSCNLNEKYVKDYDYVAFMLVTTDGAYCQPVIVAIGDNGFLREPTVTSPGEISFTPSVSGKLYYYYSKTDDLPAADDFKAEYRDASYGYSTDVTKNTEGTVSYSLDRAEDYPYMIMAICTNTNKYMIPVCVPIEYSTGFKNEPTVESDTEIYFKTETKGTLFYYYSKTSTAPDSKGFNSIYASSRYKGKLDIKNTFATCLEYEQEYAEDYPYMVIMFVGNDGTEYSPVVVKLNQAQQSGFTTTPYISGNKISFRTDADGEVWYFYTSVRNNITKKTFAASYRAEKDDNRGVVDVTSGVSNSITIDSDRAIDYPYIALAYTSDNGLTFSTPCVLDVGEAVINRMGTGLTVGTPADGTVTVTPQYSGRLYWYHTDSKDALASTSTEFKAFYGASNSGGVVWAYNGVREDISFAGYDYIVCCVVVDNSIYLQPVVIHNQTGAQSGSSSTDTTLPSYTVEDSAIIYLGSTVTGVSVQALESGTVSLVIKTGAYEQLYSETLVEADEEVSLAYPPYWGSSLGNTLGAKMYIQLVSSDGSVKYKPVEVK